MLHNNGGKNTSLSKSALRQTPSRFHHSAINDDFNVDHLESRESTVQMNHDLGGGESQRRFDRHSVEPFRPPAAGLTIEAGPIRAAHNLILIDNEIGEDRGGQRVQEEFLNSELQAITQVQNQVE